MLLRSARRCVAGPTEWSLSVSSTINIDKSLFRGVHSMEACIQPPSWEKRGRKSCENRGDNKFLSKGFSSYSVYARSLSFNCTITRSPLKSPPTIHPFLSPEREQYILHVQSSRTMLQLAYQRHERTTVLFDECVVPRLYTLLCPLTVF